MVLGDRSMLSGQFLYLPMEKVFFGAGSVNNLPAELDRIDRRRAFLITGQSLATGTDVVDRLAALLGKRLVGVYTGVRQHVPDSTVVAAAEQAREQRADLLVSLGGGSAIDTARGVAIAVATNARTTSELAAHRARFRFPDEVVIPQLPENLLPHIALPTTLSAAEFANAGAITSEDRRVKDLFIADTLTPRIVVLDPELAAHTPVDLWLATGMRAIDHAVETVYSPRHQPVTDTLSLEAIRLLATSLRRTRAEPGDIHARQQGQFAAWMSYFGEMNLTLGLSHAIGHQLGPKHNVPHGVTSCIILPQVMRFLASDTADRQALIARVLDPASSEMPIDQAAEAAARAIEHLVDDLRLPRRLRDVGVGPDSFGDIAAGVMEDLVVAGSPRPIRGPEDVITILEAAG